MNEPLYKLTDAERGPIHGGSGQWPPPGEWRTQAGKIEPCSNGLHLCRAGDLPRWLKLDAVVWSAETRGDEPVVHEDKIVVREARLVAQAGVLTHDVLRLFALECAEHVLPIFERRRPGDDRPRKALEAARAYIAGKITKEQLHSAASAACAADAAYAASAASAACAAYAADAADAAYAASAASAACAACAAYAAYAASAADAKAHAEFRAWAGTRLLALLAEQNHITPTKEP